MKTCNVCGKPKPLSEFTVRNPGSGSRPCKPCDRARANDAWGLKVRAAARLGLQSPQRGSQWMTQLTATQRRTELAKQREIDEGRIPTTVFPPRRPALPPGAAPDLDASLHGHKAFTVETDAHDADPEPAPYQDQRGYVYVIGRSDEPSWCKIGMSNNYTARVSTPNTWVPSTQEYRIVKLYPVMNMRKAERFAHSVLAPYRDGKKEIFLVPADFAVRILDRVMEYDDDHTDDHRLR